MIRRPRRRPHWRQWGTSLVGILVAMAILVVLFAVLLSGLNTAVTGSGNTTPGSVRSMEDQVQLRDITISCFIAGQNTSEKGAPTPSQRLGSSARSADTTANLYALLIAERFVEPRALVSSNERNPMVGECANYDYREVDPASKRYWDSKFTADLVTGSHVSYAHVPLYGSRAMYWTEKRFDTRFPILGTRAPANGIANPQSLTYGRDGTWAGFQAFGDGHVNFVTSFFADGLQSMDGSPDNAFAIDDGADGNDACLAFTNLMYGDGPRLQWD
ncbi:MAG: hypothetical protein SGJ11_00445 [Phycisphaerae bacterium]|nr:hypothetical protein [Phycisphaerae bacterium]